jgi:hypothetical protein
VAIHSECKRERLIDRFGKQNAQNSLNGRAKWRFLLEVFSLQPLDTKLKPQPVGGRVDNATRRKLVALNLISGDWPVL